MFFFSARKCCNCMLVQDTTRRVTFRGKTGLWDDGVPHSLAPIWEMCRVRGACASVCLPCPSIATEDCDEDEYEDRT